MTEIKATLKDHMGSDLTVVNAARVSFGKESEWGWLKPNGEVLENPECYSLKSLEENCTAFLKARDAKLIRYLAKHKHLSPFGHCFASFHVKAPIFVARQLVKHKFLRWNEVSRRYVDDEPEFYVPDVWRGRSKDKKQGSNGVVVIDDLTFPWVDYGSWGSYKQYIEICEASYQSLLREGVAPEQARMVLPTAQMTEWWWSGSLDAWASMCNLRLPSDTQYESRVVAEQVSKAMGDLFPVSWGALVTSKGDSNE